MSLTQTQRPAGRPGASLAYENRADLTANEVEAPAGKFATRLLGVYIFLLVSRVLDLSPIWWMHVPLFLLLVLALTTLVRGGIKFALESKISRYFGLFTVWVVVSFPFSAWRSASVPWVLGSVEFYLVFVIVVASVRTNEQWRAAAGSYGYGVLVAAVYSFFFAKNVDGRLALVGGTFGDPNGFALSLLIGVPFLWVKATYASAFRKVFFLSCSGIVFIAFAKAGSRGGLLALSGMLLVMFIVSNVKQRVLIFAGACIGITAAAVLLPDYLRARYFTIFTPSTSQLSAASREQLESDIQSSGERRALLQQSIYMTFEHPIFGVGPGVFASAAWDERKNESGTGGPTLVTHNTYTQISSETGFPGFFFFMGAVFFCLKYTFTDYRTSVRSGLDSAKLSRDLLLSLAALLVGIFFLSTAYSHFIALLMALAASLHNIVTKEKLNLVVVPTAAISPTRAMTGVEKAAKPLNKERTRGRVPSYLRPRGFAKSTAVQNLTEPRTSQLGNDSLDD